MQQVCFAVVVVLLAVFASPTTAAKLGNHRRVLGGGKIRIIDQPWLVSLRSNKKHVCGGTILTESFVMSAARCTRNRLVDGFSVQYGTASFNGGRKVDVSEVHLHPGFSWFYEKEDDQRFFNDIAIFKVSEPMEFTDYVKPVTLSLIRAIAYDTVFLYGWGDDQNGLPTIDAKQTYSKIFDHKDCQQAFARFDRKYNATTIEAGMICAKERGTGPCFEDLGGPLLTSDFKQIGIISWWLGSCHQNKPLTNNLPQVFTNVLYHREFIDRITDKKALWGCIQLNPKEQP